MLEHSTQAWSLAAYAAPPWVRTTVRLDDEYVTVQRPLWFPPWPVQTIKLALREITGLEVATRISRPAAIVSLAAATTALLTLLSIFTAGGLMRFVLAAAVAAVAAIWSPRTSVVITTDIDERFDIPLALGEADAARGLVDALDYAVTLAEARAAHRVAPPT